MVVLKYPSLSNEHRTIVIIGGQGTLGKSFLKSLNFDGSSVITIGRSINNDYSLDLVSDFSLLREILGFIKPSLVINCAAMVSLSHCEANPKAAFDINAYFVLRLVDLCESFSSTLVHISTDHYFDDNPHSLHDEYSFPSLINCYSSSKYLGEGYALAYSNSIVVRTNFSGFRSSSTPTYFEWLVNSASSTSKINLFDDFFTSTIDSEYLCYFVLRLLSLSFRGLINIASSSCLSKKDFVLSFFNYLGVPVSYNSISVDSLYLRGISVFVWTVLKLKRFYLSQCLIIIWFSRILPITIFSNLHSIVSNGHSSAFSCSLHFYFIFILIALVPICLSAFCISFICPFIPNLLISFLPSLIAHLQHTPHPMCGVASS